MLDSAVEDMGFLSSLALLLWSSSDASLGGESETGGGVAAREDLGGLLDSEKELSLLLILGMLSPESSTSGFEALVAGIGGLVL